MTAVAVAPFVTQTHRMVDDPATDGLIAWGRENNSFVVVDPFGFARHVLPSHFKHNNFSSFVRQLNTYGFRKVDPDRWEFAHESFLRGQTHLLHRIVRHNNIHGQNSNSNREVGAEGASGGGGSEEDEESIVEVLAKLKQEQNAIDEEVRGMCRRVQETERKPRQMLTFLVKVVENPHLHPLFRDGGEGSGEGRCLHPGDGGGSAKDATKKRGRLMISSASPPALEVVEDDMVLAMAEMGWGLEAMCPVPLDDDDGMGMLAAEGHRLPFGGGCGAVVPVVPAVDPVGDAFGIPSLFLPGFGEVQGGDWGRAA